MGRAAGEVPAAGAGPFPVTFPGFGPPPSVWSCLLGHFGRLDTSEQGYVLASPHPKDPPHTQ